MITQEGKSWVRMYIDFEKIYIQKTYPIELENQIHLSPQWAI